jgi:hypothetical protein
LAFCSYRRARCESGQKQLTSVAYGHFFARLIVF